MQAISVGMIVAGAAIQIGGVLVAVTSDPTNYVTLAVALVIGGAIESAGILLWVNNRG